MNKHERIVLRKGDMGDRHQRKLEKYSEGFNENFLFFFRLSHRGLIEFCGERIVVEKTDDPKMTAKHCFKLFEDGHYGREKVVKCRQPNIMRHVLMGKKGWGLFSGEWSKGVGERLFRKEEILEEFHKRDIVIPKCFMHEFDNRIEKAKRDFIW